MIEIPWEGGGDPRNPKGTQGNPRGPKGAFGALGGNGPMGPFGVIPKPFRMESHFEWRVLSKERPWAALNPKLSKIIPKLNI